MDNGLVGCGLVTPRQLLSAESSAGRVGGNTGSELVFSGAIEASGYAEYLATATGLERIHNEELVSCLNVSDVTEIGAVVRSSYCPVISHSRQWSYAFCIPQYPRGNGAAAARRELSGIITRQDFGDACRKILRTKLIEYACAGFYNRFPELSAARRFTPPQVFFFSTAVVGAAAALWAAPGATVHVLTLILSLFFTSVVVLRNICLIPVSHRHCFKKNRDVDESELPIYTILVPLYKEANIVKGTVQALMEIDYPASLLDIKLILEEDDTATISAVSELALPGCFEKIIVPPCEPRTKPKALDFALPFARGELLTIYDAEDRPDPDQLRLSAARFRSAPARLACLQCALTYYNSKRNWLTRQFTIEYACLFDVILPKLSSLGLPIPLGGTSNHFRTDILLAAGGWDPHNVTEDADLRFRLKRLGYEVSTLASTTEEEAVPTVGAWLRQRSRWLKGWMQTWLVHNRNPITLVTELGFAGFLVVQTLLTGVLISAIGYPFFLLLLVYQIAAGQLVPATESDFANFVLAAQAWIFATGYLVNIWLAWVAIQQRALKGFAADVLFIPLYWLLISAASWLALYQLFCAPFYWEKTTHGQT